MEEIKAGDIMIGNYLMFESTTHIVTEISETLVATRWIKGNDKYIHELSDLRSIPLTEDILLKAGFEKNRFTKYPTFKLGKVEITNVEFFDEDSEGKEFSFKEWKLSGLYGSDLFYFKSYSPNIKHFHQLQNLFKSLTGNDLKIEV